MSSEDAFAQNIRGVSDLIGSETNKITSSGDINPEGAVGDKLDVLDLPMKDEELLALRDEWERAYAPYEGKILPIFKRNLRSYLGRNKDNSLPDEDQVTAANLQFEALETFLPAALAQNPSPFVYCDNTPEGNAIAESVQTMLQFHADQLVLQRKLALMVRQWSIYHLGVLKPGWNEDIKDVALENRKVQDFIFKPDGYVDAYGDFCGWLGERIYVTAEKLIDLFPDKKAEIELEVANLDGKKNLGTEVCYTEWWNDDYCFSTFKKIVLDKHKNEFFKYPELVKYENGVAQQDIMGEPLKTQPRNHFAIPKKPYIFLSVFSLQERPHDITGLIEQNIPNQTKISKRTEQIDNNLSQGNNGILFSENNFNQETAKQASLALTKGVGKVLVPQGGPISEAVVRLQAPNLPTGFFDDLENSINNLRSSWGTQGITSRQQKPSETARGMIMNQNRDTSRIGGGIGDVIEQSVARNVFNWLVQLYMVFYDEKHFAAVLGSGKATQYIELQASDIDRQLIVGVAPNSMKPKDAVSKMNEAQQLFQVGAIGPKTLLETLDFPNPNESAGDGVLWSVDKMAYLTMNFPDLMAKLQQFQAQQQAQQQAQVQQQQAQQGQQFEQGLSQKQIEHEQKLRQGEEVHRQKLSQSEEQAAAKLSAVKIPA